MTILFGLENIEKEVYIGVSRSVQVSANVSNHTRDTITSTRGHFSRKSPHPLEIHLLGRYKTMDAAQASIAAHAQFFQDQCYRILNTFPKTCDATIKYRILSDLQTISPEALLDRTRVQRASDLNPPRTGCKTTNRLLDEIRGDRKPDHT